jgi:2-iminobutanoate/2-iminopropanoate deaminase
MKKSFIIISGLALLISVGFGPGVQAQDRKAVRKVITLDNTPVKRPYSPAIEANNTLYVSGQIAVDPATGKLVEGKIEEQTRQVLKNLKNVIEKAGYSMENVAKCTVLLSDISFYTTVNQIYMEFFPKDPPARMAFAVKDLPMGALIEIDAIAVK